MYEGGKGAGAIAGGAVLLPNTGGNIILTIASVASIVIGSAIVISAVVRLMMKKAYTKA